MKVLLLGGTGEARELAAALQPDIEVISSLAGRVPDPALPVGAVRIGGFGGAEGLRCWLAESAVDAVVDATHPFAATITANAAAACTELGLPHLVLARPAWPTDGAIPVASNRGAAEVIAEHGYRRVFLTTGRSSVTAFTGVDAWFLIRVVTAPEPGALPARHRLLLSRGPYGYPEEAALLAEHRIDVLVTKNSGGQMTRAKLTAAADHDIPVVMVQRPALPAGVDTAPDAARAAAWVRRLAATR
ncbi:cobalt-precorrin-6A reductase [Mycobacterium sp. 1274756.6]|uniref:cobalt-precorrin-6A reductase n=1 Tax=Mycobacterium sp. 1274756.6 TaxID=1834076 RepID=UPI0007FD66A4|nr:cobalt-precorrin-6A reductase [Mycobacterium sp. 1274756.6]OBJ73600.1 cobalt-precorrin-6A reductase [Mycobacterium sp. 1274756.6]